MSIPLRFRLVMLILLCVIPIGCDDKIDPVDPGDDDDLPENVTYTAHIRPLLETSCLSCHSAQVQGGDREGAPANVNFDSYTDAVAWAESSNVRIQAGTMPPSNPLSSFNRALFQRWIDQGTRE